MLLQQPLPFTVLKPGIKHYNGLIDKVATALTVYGIETQNGNQNNTKYICVATALTVYGIETYLICLRSV